MNKIQLPLIISFEQAKMKEGHTIFTLKTVFFLKKEKEKKVG